ncbi:MAG: hypothetical protein AMXMBFR13_45070 [Phycisphaerae bacterium]
MVATTLVVFVLLLLSLISPEFWVFAPVLFLSLLVLLGLLGVTWFVRMTLWAVGWSRIGYDERRPSRPVPTRGREYKRVCRHERCGRLNPPMARFCGQCGQLLD